MDYEISLDFDAPVEHPEVTVDEVFADLAACLEALCATTQSHLLQLLLQQNTRLVRCEQKLLLGLQGSSELLSVKRSEIESQQRSIDDVETRAKKLQQMLRKEKHERSEEKEWMAELWPDGLVLPSLLKPFELPKDVELIKDADDSERLQARINRRVARERVVQQIEAAQQWKVVLTPAATSPETEEVVPESVYFMNTVTGESVWQAPLAMAFEPPPQWDHARMDWKESHGIEHFYPKSVSKQGGDDTDSDADDREPGRELTALKSSRVKSSARIGDKDDDDEEEIDDKPVDPVPLREQMTQELEKSALLEKALAVSQAQQRALALQLLNASRQTFEREREALEAEDEEKKELERKKRKALLQEQAAAKAKADALEKKNSKSVQAKFGKDSVGKKDLTLSKDDALFEQELEEFVLQERADRPYLTASITLDPRVKFHHQLDEEYIHMKTMEAKVLEIEQLEFDLLEKSALRHEESKTKGEELKSLCEEIRARQPEVDQDLQSVLKTISHLEIPLSPPTEPRPNEEELQRASVRFVTVKPLDDDDDDEDQNEGSTDKAGIDPENRTGEQERQRMVDEVAKEGMTREEIDALLKDEAELLLFKSYVDAEQHWRDWEKEEAMRVDELAQAIERRKALEALQRQLALDLALYESDASFFTRLSESEKELNTRMWQIQADSQIERVRFMIERAAREEAVFQMDDHFEELKVQLEAAQRLPLQAINPLNRLELEEESQVLCTSLEGKIKDLQARYAKEMEAKKLLVELESRSCGYAHQKLEEEMKLFSEKQFLWDLNFSLSDEMQDTRKTIERLFLLMEEQKEQQHLPEVGQSVEAGATTTQLLANQQQHEEATAVFEAKLQSLQQVRQFTFTCYDREARWRNLAPIALIKDCSSDEWMTQMQCERHESMMTIMQEQHEPAVLELKKQIKLLQKVKAVLLTQIDELNTKIDRLQLAYQESSDHVRQQTENVIHALSAEIEQHKQTLRDEKKRAAEERLRLIGEHDEVREELEARLLELEEINEKQRHWLTAAKRELNAQRIANEELVKAYQSLEKRRAAETNDMRFRISSQIKKISNIEMWNLSLKLKAKEAHVERIQMQKEMDRLVEQHKQQQQLLRLKNWRHRVAAQAILTDVDLLFKFFADGLEILSGTTPEINSSLRANGAIEVMAALTQHCHQSPIKIICAKALGQLAWNANATQRSLGWQAKRQWFGWVTMQSDKILEKMAKENVSFDAVADEESVEMNWLADPSNGAGVGESDSDVVARKGKKVQFVKSWHQFDELQFPDGNSNNQEYMGLSPSILKTVIDLCRVSVKQSNSNGEPGEGELVEQQQQTQIQRNALLSLALIVMNARNTAIIGRMDGCISLLIGLIEPKELREDAQVLRNALQALSNLAFQNKFNQLAITSHGAIPHLLAFCDEATDVDLILVATQALSHLSQEETSVCEAIFDARGITALTRLCHSPRIYDTVELDVYEQIQTHAAQALANVVTILDSDDNESGHWSRDVVSVILEEEEELQRQASSRHSQRTNGIHQNRNIGGVTTFVLMCASCNRDVAFHAALVLGSISQHDSIRAAIGNAGGIDALFLLADRPQDKEMMTQATWALANLTWNRDNQYRVARYIDHLYEICTQTCSSHTQVQSTNQEQETAHPEEDDGGDVNEEELVRQIREHGLCILANSLFYNDANRQLVASQHKWMELIQRNCLQARGETLEHSARALCSLSYSDQIALAMGSNRWEEIGGKHSNNVSSNKSWELPYNGLEVFVRLCGCASNPLVQTNGLYGVINMCLHDANKTRMLDVPHGIETLVNLSGSTNKELCDPALEALELLADVSQLKKDGISSTNSLASTDIKKLIAMLSESTNPALVAMISDAIADEVWKKPSSKVKLRNEHGLEKLLELCVNPLSAVVVGGGGHAIPVDQEQKLLISCLWALRNTVADNARNQDFVGALDGVEQLVMLYDRQKRSEEVVEAILAVLVALVMKHPRNSQQLVQFGLDMLIPLAEKTDCRDEDVDHERTILPPLVPAAAPSTPTRAAARSRSGVVTPGEASADSSRHELQNAGLAKDLLHLVASYNTATGAPSLSPDKLTTMRRFQQMQTMPPLQQQQQAKRG